MLPIDRPVFFAAQRNIFMDCNVLVWIAGAALSYPVVILMVRFPPHAGCDAARIARLRKAHIPATR